MNKYESMYYKLQRKCRILDIALDICIEEHQYDFYSNKERLLQEAELRLNDICTEFLFGRFATQTTLEAAEEVEDF